MYVPTDYCERKEDPSRGPGAAFWPTICAVLIGIVVALWLMVTALRQSNEDLREVIRLQAKITPSPVSIAHQCVKWWTGTDLNQARKQLCQKHVK